MDDNTLKCGHNQRRNKMLFFSKNKYSIHNTIPAIMSSVVTAFITNEGTLIKIYGLLLQPLIKICSMTGDIQYVAYCSAVYTKDSTFM